MLLYECGRVRCIKKGKVFDIVLEVFDKKGVVPGI